jgi:hypothetical protein
MKGLAIAASRTTALRTTALRTAALLAAAVGLAGCQSLYYEGMPTKSDPYAIAVEESGIDFVSVDGRMVSRPAFASSRILLSPGPHEILTRYDESETDTDYAGDLEIQVTVHYWSSFAQVIAFETHEGNRYYIAAQANLPRTGVSYDLYQHELPPDYASTKSGRVHVTVEQELKNPDDWRPILARILPIGNYWKGRALPAAAIEGKKASPASP